jgi:hypothetical protein
MVDMSTQVSSGSGIDDTMKLSLDSATIICKNSPTSTTINFLKDEVLSLLKGRKGNITVYHSPIGFQNAKAQTKYIDYLKNTMEEVPETRVRS